MYLKGIEISGFKSFAHKTEFHFEDGITGIVGPNGSGKSNIADAMRWVLGEQSAKQLRSSSMQDVIFAGTETRRQQGYAYVNIIFDNSDHVLPIEFDEVTIGRRVYRSGESEYLINSSPCRLRDVQELFYDTGIGKEGYSIIGQGQIDKILSGKPEERRELFDEAAGIVKFKIRKKTAMNRLEKEQEAIVRIQDILSELERQEGPLKNQAEKARIYLKLHDELREHEVTDYQIDVHESAEKLAKADEKLVTVNEQMGAFKAELERIRLRYSSLHELLELRNTRIENLRTSLEEKRELTHSHKTEAEKLESQIVFAGEHAALLKSQKEQNLLHLAKLKEEADKLEREYADLKRDLENLRNTGEESEQRVNELSERLESNEQELSAKHNKENQLTEKKSGLMMDKQRMDTLAEQIELQIAQFNGRILQEKSLLEEAVASIRKGKAEYKKAEENILKKREEIRLNGEEIKTLSQETARARSEADQLRNKALQVKARFDTLQNVAERYEGYGQSVRRLLEQRRLFPGIYGVLADLIQVDAKYEVAIETALGGALQNIVTDNEKTAKDSIEFLKRNRFGRATFLPVSTVHPKGAGPDSKALSQPGVLGTADSLVRCDDRYRDIIRSLLARIVVADTMDHALAVAARYHYSFRIVTLEGESLNTGGSISGGAYKNNSNLLGRNRELMELEKAFEEAANISRTADKKVSDLSVRLQEATARKDTLLSQMQALQLEASGIELTLRQNRDQKDASGDELTHLMAQLEDLKEKKDTLISDNETADQTADTLEDDLKLLHAEIEELERLQEDLRESRERISKESVDIKLRLSSLSEKEIHFQENHKRVCQERESAEALNKDLDGQLAEIEEGNVQKRKQILVTNEMIKEEQVQIEQLRDDIARENQESENDRKEQQTLFGKQEELSTEVAALEREWDRLSGQKTALEENLERKAAYLWEEYELTPSEAEKYQMKEVPAHGELKKNIQSLKSRIRSLGSINTAAVEEYEELSQRLGFLKEQHADLVHGRENLQQIIDQLDQDMRNQFSEKFVEIQKEFDKVFKELFGGGSGTILLEEGEEMLETGILIHAQPPGKKLQNMMQLSGGEKSLTAIALLFAIQNLKPSPFCILDEIEAALDDANVDRFAKYLDKLKANTQFIVITHRRGTMLIADQLYGITMQEKGISSLVSVNLIDAADME